MRWVIRQLTKNSNENRKMSMQKNKIEIVHEDDDLIVINKPAGISVTADRSGKEDILTVLARQVAAGTDLRLIHRLDKFTSGVMLVAKNLPTQSKYSSMLEKRLIKKTYLALASGAIFEDGGTIDVGLARNRKNDRVMRIDRKRGKPAITHWKQLADFGVCSLLAVSPVTGRTHQIRVHLASEDMPLVIDPLYSATRPIMLSDVKTRYRQKKGQPEKPLMDRLTLHAYQIEIPADESSNPPAVYTAKLDKKFTACVKMLTKHNLNGPEAFRDPDTLQKILAGEALP